MNPSFNPTLDLTITPVVVAFYAPHEIKGMVQS